MVHVIGVNQETVVGVRRTPLGIRVHDEQERRRDRGADFGAPAQA